jgi:hypothetical protein
MDGVGLDGISRNCPKTGSEIEIGRNRSKSGTEIGRNRSKSGTETGRNESNQILGSRNAHAQAQSCQKEDLKRRN